MVTKNKLVTQQIILNGVRTSVTHSSKLVLPKVINTEPRATNNLRLKKLAADCLKC